MPGPARRARPPPSWDRVTTSEQDSEQDYGSGVLDLTYPPILLTARTLMYGIDMRFDLQGQHHIPRRGGAVIARLAVGGMHSPRR